MRTQLAALVYLLFTAFFLCGHAKRAAPRKRELIAETGPSDEAIEDTGLLSQTVTAATVYEKSRQWHAGSAEVKKTGSTPVLGYVTPWHPSGYEFSVRFRAKLTHVAPVWYQLRRTKKEDGTKEWVLTGGHEFNQTWIDAVRAPVQQQGSGCSGAGEEQVCSAVGANEPGNAKKTTKIVPRVVVEVDEAQDHLELVQAPDAARALIVEEVKAKGYDGVVLEVWMVWTFMNGFSNPPFRAAAFNFIKGLSRSLKALPEREAGMGRRELILAVPPTVPSAPARPRIEPAHMDELTPFVDAWSVMTYDFSIASGPQPNAPVQWLESNMKLLTEEAESVKKQPTRALMGLNFYGYDYTLNAKSAPSAIKADSYLMALEMFQPVLEWKDDYKEHVVRYEADKPHVMYYPSARSIQLRLELFASKGMGVSIWDLGQGLDRFFDLF